MASTLQEIPLDKIAVKDGHNPRTAIDADALQQLAESIRTVGVLQPIVVYAVDGANGTSGGFVLVAGERRYRAASIAGLTEIPAVIRTGVNGDALNVAITENLHREQLTPLEEARAFQRACDTGMTPADLAAAISVSEQLVKDRLALLKLPDPVQAKIDARELTLAAAKSLQAFTQAGDIVVAKAAELVTKEYDQWDEPITPRDLERDPAFVLEQALDELLGGPGAVADRGDPHGEE